MSFISNIINVVPAAHEPRAVLRAPHAGIIVGSSTTLTPGRRIGEGKYARVCEALDVRSNRKVALKKVDLRQLRRARQTDKIGREVQCLSAVQQHVNVVKMFDFFHHGNDVSFVIELCEANAMDCLSQHPAHLEDEVANIAAQVLQGLSHMHARGVVHRDIKGANLLVTATGTVKIADFGEAEFVPPTDIVTRTSGTPAFQAPEIARGDEFYYGTKLDVWALGVTVYQMLSGRLPFNGNHILQLYKNIRKGEYEPLENVSAECRSAIAKMLTVSSADRPSVNELLRHPWIVNALRDGGEARQGWVRPSAREFGELDILRVMGTAKLPGTVTSFKKAEPVQVSSPLPSQQLVAVPVSSGTAWRRTITRGALWVKRMCGRG